MSFFRKVVDLAGAELSDFLARRGIAPDSKAAKDAAHVIDTAYEAAHDLDCGDSTKPLVAFPKVAYDPQRRQISINGSTIEVTAEGAGKVLAALADACVPPPSRSHVYSAKDAEVTVAGVKVDAFEERHPGYVPSEPGREVVKHVATADNWTLYVHTSAVKHRARLLKALTDTGCKHVEEHSACPSPSKYAINHAAGNTPLVHSIVRKVFDRLTYQHYAFRASASNPIDFYRIASDSPRARRIVLTFETKSGTFISKWDQLFPFGLNDDSCEHYNAQFSARRGNVRVEVHSAL
jgi:hypothetical protein